MWKDRGETSRKPRLVSDVNVPAPLVDKIRKRKIEVKMAKELGLEKMSDSDLLSTVSAKGYVLITLDADFWSDRKIPLQKCGGLVQIENTNPGYSDSDGFELLMVLLESLGGLGRGVKFKSTATQLFTKNIGDNGKKVLYEIRAIRPLVYAREIEEA
jgi:predicted nuclease of predicted toxin-antitoxin system